MKLLSKTLAVAGAFWLMVGPAQAAVTTFTDLTSFNAAAGPTALIDFEGSSFTGLTPQLGLWYTNDTAGFELGGATFSVIGGVNFGAIIPPTYDPSIYDRGTGNVFHAEGSQAMNIALSGPTRAFALDLSTDLRAIGEVILSFSNGDVASASLGDPFAFNGFLTDTPFSSVTISPVTGDYLLIDNVRVSAVPVPATLPLLLSGLGAMGFFGWRRKRPAVA